MAIIQNIPQTMIVEHINWHSRPGNPAAGGRRINPWPPFGGGPAAGSGEEFLVWHEGFVARFHQWVNNLPQGQRPPAASIEAWRTIPQGLKMSMLGWNAERADDEVRLSDMSNFSSLDALGRALEWGLHGWLHNAAAGMWSEPVLLSFESPRSSYFWQLHGLIDHWRQQWVDAQDQAPGPSFVPLELGGPEVQASIGAPGEVDRYQFLIIAPGRFAIGTKGATDVVMDLAGPNNAGTLITSDDDSGGNGNARIARQLTPGSYFVYVTHFAAEGTGNYSIAVTPET